MPLPAAGARLQSYCSNNALTCRQTWSKLVVGVQPASGGLVGQGGTPKWQRPAEQQQLDLSRLQLSSWALSQGERGRSDRQGRRRGVLGHAPLPPVAPFGCVGERDGTPGLGVVAGDA